jgi:LysR family transcriptional regulator, nitrogen assimilation regulatory protein
MHAATVAVRQTLIDLIEELVARETWTGVSLRDK